jgi:hypothetical protein
MDKNKFWLGGRLFNTASPRLGPNQRKERQVGRPNATQGTSASWAPQCTSATQMQGTRPQVGRPNATQGTSASWEPQRTSATQTQGTQRPQLGCPNATQARPQVGRRKCNARRLRKMVAQTQNSSATKTYTQGSTRLKDELEDG